MSDIQPRVSWSLQRTDPAGRSFSLLMSARLCALCLTLCMAGSGCSLHGERVAPFHGRVVTLDTVALDSSADVITAQTDTVIVDITDYTGILVYDMQMDGLLDDTAVFYGDESGEFEGVLPYENPVLLRAPWVRKPVHLLISEIGLDTYLYVDAHNTGAADAEVEMMTFWEALFAKQAGSALTESADEDK